MNNSQTARLLGSLGMRLTAAWPPSCFRIQCAVSTLSVVACASTVYVLLEGDWSRIWSMYLVPILIFNGWITMVTYLQVRQQHGRHPNTPRV
jgi:hypothetical protein